MITIFCSFCKRELDLLLHLLYLSWAWLVRPRGPNRSKVWVLNLHLKGLANYILAALEPLKPPREKNLGVTGPWGAQTFDRTLFWVSVRCFQVRQTFESDWLKQIVLCNVSRLNWQDLKRTKRLSNSRLTALSWDIVFPVFRLELKHQLFLGLQPADFLTWT